MPIYNQEQTRERIAAWAVGLIGVVAVVLGVWQIYRNTTDPFIPKVADTNVTTTSNTNAQSLAALQTKDTDLDGLSDFDELYVYETSPYLADSDSDSITDQREIVEGKNPNCKEGSSCSAYSPNTRPTISTGLEGSGSTNTSVIPTNTNRALSASELRSLLTSSGAPAELLSQYSDEQLMALYADTASELGASSPTTGGARNTNVFNDLVTNTTTPTNTSSSTYSYQTLANLSAAQVRELLSSAGGIDKATLDQLTDEQLLAIYQQALQEEFSGLSTTNVNGQ